MDIKQLYCLIKKMYFPIEKNLDINKFNEDHELKRNKALTDIYNIFKEIKNETIYSTSL